MFASVDAKKIAHKPGKIVCVRTLADQVNDYLAGTGVTASELARQVGVKRQNIDNLCAGSVRAPRYLARLAAVMGTTVEALDAGAYVFADPRIKGSGPQVAHAMSHMPFNLPPLLTREALMQTEELPARFRVRVPDGALGSNLPEGTEVVFERAETARPRQCVLVEDRRGSRYIRRYVQGHGGEFKAEALDDAYLSLDSKRDGLRVLAVMAWREQTEV